MEIFEIIYQITSGFMVVSGGYVAYQIRQSLETS